MKVIILEGGEAVGKTTQCNYFRDNYFIPITKENYLYMCKYYNIEPNQYKTQLVWIQDWFNKLDNILEHAFLLKKEYIVLDRSAYSALCYFDINDEKYHILKSIIDYKFNNLKIKNINIITIILTCSPENRINRILSRADTESIRDSKIEIQRLKIVDNWYNKILPSYIFINKFINIENKTIKEVNDEIINLIN